MISEIRRTHSSVKLAELGGEGRANSLILHKTRETKKDEKKRSESFHINMNQFKLE